MEVMYTSTRGDQTQYTASQAVLKGLAKDGGLFVPNRIPKLERSLAEMGELTYQDTAYEVMRHFLTDYTKEELMGCIQAAYDDSLIHLILFQW